MVVLLHSHTWETNAETSDAAYEVVQQVAETDDTGCTCQVDEQITHTFKNAPAACLLVLWSMREE